MIEVVEAATISLVLGFWAWAVLDVVSRPAAAMADRRTWLAACIVGGPAASAAYVVVRRPGLGPLPRVDHGCSEKALGASSYGPSTHAPSSVDV